MKKNAIALAALLTLAGGVHADEVAKSGFYMGFTAGKHMLDDSSLGTITMTGGAAVGLTGGYNYVMPDGKMQIAVEAAFTGSDFEITPFPSGTCTIELSTTAFYAVMRGTGKYYGKVRGGRLTESLLSRDACVGLIDTSASGASYGIGGGIRFSENGSLELEYTLVEKDVNQLSANLMYHF